MSDALTMPAEKRERAGKGASRALRREGRIPAVIYGGKKDPVSIHVEERLLVKQLNTGHFMNTIVTIELDGEKTRTIPKDVSLDPVRDVPLHVDFYRLVRGAKIEVSIPVVFTGEEESPALTKGGVLNVVRHELDLVCDAEHIPDQIEISVAGKDVGDSIHISEITLPEDTESAITDRDFTIATFVAPSALKRAEDDQESHGDGEEVTETEVTEQHAETVMGESDNVVPG